MTCDASAGNRRPGVRRTLVCAAAGLGYTRRHGLIQPASTAPSPDSARATTVRNPRSRRLPRSSGLPIDQALRLAAPFGGGIGRQGEVCGAAAGALMALGLRFGGAVADKAAKERAYAVAAEFVRRFEDRTGALRCRDLIHADMSTPEGMADARERKVFATDCPRFVAAAVEIAGELIDGAASARPPRPGVRSCRAKTAHPPPARAGGGWAAYRFASTPPAGARYSPRTSTSSIPSSFLTAASRHC